MIVIVARGFAGQELLGLHMAVLQEPHPQNGYFVGGISITCDTPTFSRSSTLYQVVKMSTPHHPSEYFSVCTRVSTNDVQHALRAADCIVLGFDMF